MFNCLCFAFQAPPSDKPSLLYSHVVRTPVENLVSWEVHPDLEPGQVSEPAPAFYGKHANITQLFVFQIFLQFTVHTDELIFPLLIWKLYQYCFFLERSVLKRGRINLSLCIKSSMVLNPVEENQIKGWCWSSVTIWFVTLVHSTIQLRSWSVMVRFSLFPFSCKSKGVRPSPCPKLLADRPDLPLQHSAYQ